jgi:hypothetical protein
MDFNTILNENTTYIYQFIVWVRIIKILMIIDEIFGKTTSSHNELVHHKKRV